MSMLRTTLGFIVIAVSAFQGVSAEAGNNRSVVSTTGLDTNNCSVPAPCRSLAAALAATNPSGEIIVLDSGGYGPASITQPVTITAPVGVRASVFTATAINGLNINTTGNVVIKGISFLGGGNGVTGIFVNSVGVLHLDSVEVQDFMNGGIDFETGELFVANSVVRDCGLDGLTINATSAYVRGSSFVHNGHNGIVLDKGNVVVVDSVASFNASDGVVAFGGTLNLLRVETVLNGGAGIGVSSSGATVGFDYSLAVGNGLAFDNTQLGTLSGSSPATSLLNGTHLGTVSPAAGLQ